MNRETKRIRLEKGYYRSHACLKPFTCKVCGREVVPEGAGSEHRNHCPNCLSSLHLDTRPGDRAADCGGIMDPVGVWVRKNGEWAVFQPPGGRRQPADADVDRPPPAVQPAFPADEAAGDGRGAGKRRGI